MTQFHQRTVSKDGYYARCKECIKEERKVFYKANKNKILRQNKLYAQKHREIARKSSADWRAKNPDRVKVNRYKWQRKINRRHLYEALGKNQDIYDYALSLFETPCFYCGGIGTEIDHLIPKSRGGTDQKENLVSACKACNSSKGSKSLDEYIEFCNLVGKKVLTHGKRKTTVPENEGRKGKPIEGEAEAEDSGDGSSKADQRTKESS